MAISPSSRSAAPVWPGATSVDWVTAGAPFMPGQVTVAVTDQICSNVVPPFWHTVLKADWPPLWARAVNWVVTVKVVD